MATSYLTGIDGSVTFPTGYVSCVTSWTVNFAAEDVETTCLGDSWKTRIPGLKEWSGTYTQRLTTTLDTWKAGSSGLSLGLTSAAATFTAGANTIVGNIIITGADINLAIGGTTGEVTFTFVGDGTPTSMA